MNSTAAVRDLLRPYLPIWLRERIGIATMAPGSIYSCAATILYADLSGFTSLTAAFAELPGGAERLYESLNRLYGVLTDAILAHHGDVVSIAGDALTAWWPDRVDLDLGRRCGEQMLVALADLPEIETPSGPFRLDLRVGVAAGPAQAVLAGLPSHGVHLVLLGPTLAAATDAEQETAPGTVAVVTPPLALTIAPLPLPQPAAGLVAETTTLSEEHFLPPSFVERLRLNALIAEYRRCVPVFAAFNLPPQPEELHSLVAHAQTIVLRWGGWLNEVEIGDKGSLFVLLFGAPIAHGDDTTRAVGCCLELRERGLIERAAITAGTLFVGAVGSPDRRVYTARGDEMNLAAHLLLHAARGEILVSGRVREDVAGRYWVGPVETVQVKGHTIPIPVARVIPEQPGQRPAAFQAAAPLIGRDVERRALNQAMQAALAGNPRLVILEGEAGIGKSTLLYDLLARWGEHGLKSYSTVCSSGNQATPLLAWRNLAHALQQDDPRPADQNQLLQRWLAGEVEPPPQELCAPLLALVERALQNGPLMLCFEDIHWADDYSLYLIGRLFGLEGPPLATRAALLVTLSLRPADNTTLRALRALPGAVPLRLGRLNDSESEEMIRLLLGVNAVEPHLAFDLYTHTDGQPLFIKESLLALRQRNLIGIDEGLAYLMRDTVALAASESAQDIVQAMVDRLDEETRLTLKVAAVITVIGRSFPLRLLAAIHPARPAEASLRRQLALLSQLGLVELVLEGPEQAYRFKYKITRDVAYTRLLFGQRRTLHVAVAHWYETMFRVELTSNQAPLAVYDLLIEHLRLAEESDWRARHCRAAAARAARQYLPMTALGYLDTALPLTTDLTMRHDLILLRVAINDRCGNQFTQADDLVILATLTTALADPLRSAYVAFYQTRSMLAMGFYQTALSAALHTGQLARRAAHTAQHAQQRRQALVLRLGAIDALSSAHAALGRLERAATLTRRVLAIYPFDAAMLTIADAHSNPEAGAPEIPTLLELPILIAQCYNNLGAIRFAQGMLHEAEQLHRRALEIARFAGDWIDEARARERLGRVALARQDYATALSTANTALTTGQASGDRLVQAMALHQIASIHVARGDLGEAHRVAIHAHAISAAIRSRALEIQILQDIAVIARRLSLEEEADAALSEIERLHTEWWSEGVRG